MWPWVHHSTSLNLSPGGKTELSVATIPQKWEPVKDGPGIITLSSSMYLHLDCGWCPVQLQCTRRKVCQDRTIRLPLGVLRALALSEDQETPLQLWPCAQRVWLSMCGHRFFQSWLNILGKLSAPVLSLAELGPGLGERGAWILVSFKSVLLTLYPIIYTPPHHYLPLSP